MATNVYTITTAIQLRNGTLIDSFTPDTYQADQTTALLTAGVQIIGFAAHEILDLGDVTSAGPAGFTNLDAANYVEIGRDSGGTFIPFCQIPAGKSQVIWLVGGVVYYAKANTANVNLKKWIGSR